MPTAKRPRLEEPQADEIRQAKERVRAVALQPKPDDSLLLLLLDDLTRAAVRLQDENAPVFQELQRQAALYQDRISLPSLILSVLGGGASDHVSKAVSKCLKEKKIKDQEGKGSERHEQRSPLANLYGPPGQVYPQPPPAQSSYPGQGYGGYRPYYYPFNETQGGRGRGRNRPVRPMNCFFCSSSQHWIKDCPKMKEAKEKFA